ncbi:C2H2-type zinc finger protein [Candidatus Dependentiae bacterium]|nr:C2H2-type zinc finger protein [Candidatus Dependentiae bacterium]
MKTIKKILFLVTLFSCVPQLFSGGEDDTFSGGEDDTFSRGESNTPQSSCDQSIFEEPLTDFKVPADFALVDEAILDASQRLEKAMENFPDHIPGVDEAVVLMPDPIPVLPPNPTRFRPGQKKALKKTTSQARNFKIAFASALKTQESEEDYESETEDEVTPQQATGKRRISVKRARVEEDNDDYELTPQQATAPRRISVKRASGKRETDITAGTPEKPYACDTCNKRFTTKYSLKEHTRIHTGEKPYVCRKCGKGFTHSRSRTSHEKTEHEIITVFPGRLKSAP